MMNPFVIKKYAAIISAQFIAVILFYVGVVFYGLMYGLVFLFLGLIVGVIFANVLLKNPFTQMLEGKGIITFKLDSTGIIQPFIVKVDLPYIRGRILKKYIEDIFDRSGIYQLATPLMAKIGAKVNVSLQAKKNLSQEDLLKEDNKQLEKKGLVIELTNEEYNNARFQFLHYPCILWNDIIHSILTKDFFSEKEKSLFAEHPIIYLNRKTEELTSHIRNFARYIVDSLKPSAMSGWGWYVVIGIIVLFVVAMAIMFGPMLINAVGDAAKTASTSLPQNTVTARG